MTLRNVPVAVRLFAVIAFAVAMGLVLGGLQVATAVRQANQFARVTTLARLGQAGIALAQALEDERAASAVDLARNHGSGAFMPQDLSAADRTTGAAAARFEALASSINGAYPASIRTRVLAVDGLIESLPALRGEVRSDGTAAPAGAQLNAVINYSNAITAIFQLTDVIAEGSNDAVLTGDVQSLGALSRAEDQVSQQRAMVLAALTSFEVDPAMYGGPGATQDMQQLQQALAFSRIKQGGYVGSFEVSATPAQNELLMSAAFLQPNASIQVIEDYLSIQQEPDLSGLGMTTNGSGQWDQVSQAAVAQYSQVESQLAQAIVSRSASLQRNVQRTALQTAILTGAVLLLVLLAGLLVGRSLLLPLRRLRAGALEIAAVRLPERVKAIGEGADPESLTVEPIAMPSTDEIGQLARAFDLVHQEAVRLAGNEAHLRGNLNAMFVSLSRRSQSLIERLARMIDTLELSEDDPERLASLFAMDHLITRMRRNSENLLVLAGYEGARKRTDPVLLADVARAATSEIEQYDRVVLNVQPGIEVSGQASTDVVHLLAEIIENATLYSPRTTEVRLTGQEPPTGGVLIEITDSGVGISESRLEELNWRLEHPPVIDVSASRHMGLFAVAHLAARHGIRVRLRPSSPRGLAAMIWLPATVATSSATGYNERLRRLGGRPIDAWQLTGPERGSARADGRVGGRVPAGNGASRNTDSFPSVAQASGSFDQASPKAQPAAWAPGHRALPKRQPLVRAAARQAPTTGQETVHPNTVHPNTVQPSTVRPASNWFRPRRPANGQPAGGSSDGLAPGQDGWREQPGLVPPSWAAPQPSGGGLTVAGLPSRIPQASRTSPGTSQSGAWDVRPDAVTAPLPSPHPSGPFPSGPFPSVSSVTAPRHPLPQRSPEAARSRLAGFQRGSRRAEGQVPRAGEEAER
jgi:signal transduction histidine kinase